MNLETYVRRHGLLGAHVLSGVWSCNVKLPEDDWNDHASSMLFMLDGCVYQSIEDPSDGYRSHLDSFREVPELFPVNWWWSSERVYGYWAEQWPERYGTDELETRWWAGVMPAMDDDEWYREEKCACLVYESVITQKRVLTIGTANIGDYYPTCVQQFNPQNMSLNSEDRGLIDIVGWGGAT